MLLSDLAEVPVQAAGSLSLLACDPAETRGRRHPEPAAPTRNAFQRDRDRIVHSTAFRRLVYKTQVFLNHEGDLFRTRLTHSLEVAQLGRSIARALGLNEDLVEAVALAHDLGHTPFGHAGQDALNECMAEHGGFEHNLQSLRVVDELEERYADFNGLNLCFETREGILKHCSAAHARQLGDVGERFLSRTQPSLEAQLANLADEVAYNNHDIDDGLRSGLITLEQLQDVSIFERHHAYVLDRYPGVVRSFANSSGCFLGPDFAFDTVRPGICLYGGGPEGRPDPRIAAVATLTAEVLQVRDVLAGESVGYSRGFVAERPMRAAVVAAGGVGQAVASARRAWSMDTASMLVQWRLGAAGPASKAASGVSGKR